MKTLFFVYNANSGLIHSAFDVLHKLVSPDTYSCNLCAITHGYLGEKKAWKTFVDQLEYTIEYFHKDEWIELYPEFNSKKENPFPAIYICSNGSLKALISSNDLKHMALEDLKEALKNLKLE